MMNSTAELETPRKKWGKSEKMHPNGELKSQFRMVIGFIAVMLVTLTITLLSIHAALSRKSRINEIVAGLSLAALVAMASLSIAWVWLFGRAKPEFGRQVCQLLMLYSKRQLEKKMPVLLHNAENLNVKQALKNAVLLNFTALKLAMEGLGHKYSLREILFLRNKLLEVSQPARERLSKLLLGWKEAGSNMLGSAQPAIKIAFGREFFAILARKTHTPDIFTEIRTILDTELPLKPSDLFSDHPWEFTRH